MAGVTYTVRLRHPRNGFEHDLHYEPRCRPCHRVYDGHTKLTWAEVDAIRASKEPQRRLAGRYGVSQSTIGRILQGKLWEPTGR